MEVQIVLFLKTLLMLELCSSAGKQCQTMLKMSSFKHSQNILDMTAKVAE